MFFLPFLCGVPTVPFLPLEAKRIRTLTRGQQAHPPARVLQQVALPGQKVDSSHLLSGVPDAMGKAGTLANQGSIALPEGSSHVLLARLQTVSWGQQWRWSSQHTAYGEMRVRIIING